MSRSGHDWEVLSSLFCEPQSAEPQQSLYHLKIPALSFCIHVQKGWFLLEVKHFQAFASSEWLLHSVIEVAAFQCWVNEPYGAKPHLPESLLCEKTHLTLGEKRRKYKWLGQATTRWWEQYSHLKGTVQPTGKELFTLKQSSVARNEGREIRKGTFKW